MGLPERTIKARLYLSECLVGILRPASATDEHVPLNERLVGYAIAAGSYSGRPLGIVKITESVGLPRSTVRGVINSLMARGWVIKRTDGAYDFSAEFHEKADEWFGLEAKYQAVIRAAALIAALDP